MPPNPERLETLCPSCRSDFINNFLSGMNDMYFRSFSEADIARHITGLNLLGNGDPVRIQLLEEKDRNLSLVVLTYNFPSVFSLLTGILSSLKFDITDARIYTWKRKAVSSSGLRQVRRKNFSLSSPQWIVDQFRGVLLSGQSIAEWTEQLRVKLRKCLLILQKKEEKAQDLSRSLVNQWVAGLLAEEETNPSSYLQPVKISMETMECGNTVMNVTGPDTPFFLYALSTALVLQSVSIEQIDVKTSRGEVSDRIELADLSGNSLQDPGRLDSIRLSVLLTKQFTWFISQSPDPYQALIRFQDLVRSILDKGAGAELLSDPSVLKELARLLGASDFLWEDFIRTQYESLLPALGSDIRTRQFRTPPEKLAERLNGLLKQSEDLEEQKSILNQFKDQEIYWIDLDHILDPEADFRTLSFCLTVLAECVISKSFGIICQNLIRRFGSPTTVAGLKTPFAVFGLGKMGGSALGYASDIELLCIYSDKGTTSGPNVRENSWFFDELVRGVTGFIETKREGIFRLDLRLRPHGSAGPLAVRLERFCEYYAPGGPSHAYERLALVRLRYLSGDPAFGHQVERIRDNIIYEAHNPDVPALEDMRIRQLQQKTSPDRVNAKYSPGALVDLEYSVQILQVLNGKKDRGLRTPSLHTALRRLAESGLLKQNEMTGVEDSYYFFRKLINGLRMLRGSALDLFLPLEDSNEYEHLARRIGYEPEQGVKAGQKLAADLKVHRARILNFAEKNFRKLTDRDYRSATVADIILSRDLDPELANKILARSGFQNPSRALENLKCLAGQGQQTDIFARLSVLSVDLLSDSPDPDMAVNNLERFVRSLEDAESFYELLLAQPMRIQLLLQIFSGSQFLSDILIRTPDFLERITVPAVLHKLKKKQDFYNELIEISKHTEGHDSWLNRLRRYRKREILRIGTRDLCLHISVPDITAELSDLASALLDAVLFRRLKGNTREGFSVLAFGKLGGHELNYSSDIDLIGLCRDQKDVCFYSSIMEDLCADLTSHTEEGFGYRIDLRLRPYGRSGELVYSKHHLMKYYQEHSSQWEVQALLKLSCAAGDPVLAEDFLVQIRHFLSSGFNREKVLSSMMRNRLKSHKINLKQEHQLDVKNGPGGIRDIEFLTQTLQLIHASEHQDLIIGNTLFALRRLFETGCIHEKEHQMLSEAYLFFRRVEHFLQIFENRQIHSLPENSDAVQSLSRRVLGRSESPEDLFDMLHGFMTHIRALFDRYCSEDSLTTEEKRIKFNL